MRTYRSVIAAAAFAAATVTGASASAQTLPMEAIKDAGQGGYPVYEGWDKNPDGSFTMLFGDFNRNSKQTLDVAVGPNNRIEPFGPGCRPADALRSQARMGRVHREGAEGLRHQEGGVDADRKRLHQLRAGPSRSELVHRAIRGRGVEEPPAGASGSSAPDRPFLGPPVGVAAELNAFAAEPLLLALLASDVKPTANLATRTRPSRERLDLTWTKFRGPGRVVFGNHKPPVENGQASTTATFAAPGEYILRVEANDETGEGGGGFQCCWTSAHVRVTVRPAVATTGQ